MLPLASRKGSFGRHPRSGNRRVSFILSVAVIALFALTEYVGPAAQSQLVERETPGSALEIALPGIPGDWGTPLALASGDLNEDGGADLISAYEASGGGLLALHLGLQRSHTPLFSPAGSVGTSHRPDLIKTGDFDGDGHLDVLTAQRGDARLYLLSGDGKGSLADPIAFELTGSITALATSETADVVVGIESPQGPQLVRVDLRRHTAHVTPADARLISLGNVDADNLADIVAADRNELLVVYGNGQPPTRRAFEYEITSLAVGDFLGDGNTRIALLVASGTVYLLNVDSSGVEVLRSDAGPGASLVNASNELAIVEPESDLLRRRLPTASWSRLEIEGLDELVALLPMRLNSDSLGDFVALYRDGRGLVAIVTQAAMTFTVANTADSGVGSLRQAILDANANSGVDTIAFQIGSGAQTINLLSPLPTISEAVIIDGFTQPGFAGTPIIEINGASAGPMFAGLNVGVGSCTIRGLVIKTFTGAGIALTGGGNIVINNIITTNTGTGVVVVSGTGNSLTFNSIFANGGLGIDLGNNGVSPNDPADGDVGANNLQNFPVLTVATASGGGVSIQGTLDSLPNTDFRIEFFANSECDAMGFGEGQSFIGARTVRTDFAGNVAFAFTLPAAVAPGQIITATAANALTNDTSEFSRCVQVGGVAGGQPADLSVSIAMSPSSAQTGSDVTKTILVANIGPGTATSVTVTDSLPSGLVFVSCSATGGGVCGGSGSTRTVTFPSLAPGSNAVIIIVARVSCTSPGGSSIGNTAAVFSSVTADPNPANNLATATITTINPSPTIACPAGITQNNDLGRCSATVNYAPPVVNDNCPGWTLICSPPSGSSFPVGTTTVNCIVTDAGGARAQCSFNVTVNDTERLSILCPSNVTVTAPTGQCTPAVTYPAPTVLDNCPGVSATCSPPSGSPFPVGTTVVTCSATDSSDLRVTCSFSVIVTGRPQANVLLEGGGSALEYAEENARRKPKKEGRRQSRNFTIENTGCVPLVVTLDSITRTGSDVDRGRITDPDDRRLYTVRVVDADGTETRLDILSDVVIPPGQRRRFRVLISPVIPPVARDTRGLAASQVLPDRLTSRLTFRQNGGSPIVINLIAFVEGQVKLINPDVPKKAALVTLSKSGDEFIAEYSIYDADLNVNRAVYQFLDRGGNPVLQELSVSLGPLVQQSGLVRGQSFTIAQRLTGAKDHPEVAFVRVTVFDDDSSDTATSTNQITSNSFAAVSPAGTLLLPDVDIGRLSSPRRRTRQ